MNNLSLIKKIKIVSFFILIVGLVYYQVVKGEYFSTRAYSNYIRLIPQEAPRGLIFGRKGKTLIKNALQFQVSLFSSGEDEKVFESVAKTLGVEVKLLKKNYAHNFTAPFVSTVIYSTTNREKILRLQEKDLPDMVIKPKAKRLALMPYSASHIVGFTRKLSQENVFLKKYGYIMQEEIGYSGIERAYDNYLRGKHGGVQLEVDSQSQIVNLLSEKLPIKGKDIYTTVDAEIQNIAYESLKNYRGCIILMHSESGKIISLVSSPSFNINAYTAEKDYFKKIARRKSRPLLNRAIQGEYPPGSVFKIVVALASLQEKKVSSHTAFFCKGAFKLKNASFRCWHTHGRLDIKGAIAQSCNVYFYNLGLALGEKSLNYYARLLGLGSATGIDLPFEKKGFVPTKEWKKKVLRERWYQGDSINFSIGQGYLLVTPIQMAKVINFFASRGYLIQPHLVNRIGDVQISLRKKDLLANIEAKNIDAINQGLRAAVKDKEGTAHILEALKLNIAGKTGTAQVAGRKAHGWFAGFFPFERPEYVIVVMLENVGSSFEACRIARSFLSTLKERNLLSIKKE